MGIHRRPGIKSRPNRRSKIGVKNRAPLIFQKRPGARFLGFCACRRGKAIFGEKPARINGAEDIIRLGEGGTG